MDKKNLNDFLNLKSIIMNGIKNPEIVGNQFTGKFLDINAYDHFFDTLNNNQCAKSNPVARNLALLSEYDSEVVEYVKKEFISRYKEELDI